MKKRACGVVPLIVTSQRPSSGRPLSSVRGDKRDAVADADRQFAAALDLGARIGIDVGGAGFRLRGPGADG